MSILKVPNISNVKRYIIGVGREIEMLGRVEEGHWNR
jgi:hypothetical protein